MKAHGRQVNMNSKTIHRNTCKFLGYGSNMQPLSKIPAPMRTKLHLCQHCRP